MTEYVSAQRFAHGLCDMMEKELLSRIAGWNIKNLAAMPAEEKRDAIIDIRTSAQSSISSTINIMLDDWEASMARTAHYGVRTWA